MKNLIIFLFIYSLFVSCKKQNEDLNPYPKYFLASGEPKENAILLKWTYGFNQYNYSLDSTHMSQSIEFIKPDRFVVYMGENPINLKPIKDINPLDSSFNITNLKTGVPYFLQVKMIFNLHKYEIMSQVIVTIPGKYESPVRMSIPNNFITNDIKGQIFYISYSPDTTQFVASIREKGAFFYNYKTNKLTKISNNFGLPIWSSTGDELLITKSYFDFTSTLANIEIFNNSSYLEFPQIKKKINLSYNTIDGYTWSRDEKNILFAVPLPTPAIIKKIDLETNQIENFSEPSRSDKSSLNWIDNNNLLIGGFSSLNGLVHNGYSGVLNSTYISSPVIYNTSTKTYQNLWNDTNIGSIGFPTLIQKNTKLAYISNQSGYAAIWIYDIKNNTFRQFTQRLSSEDIAIYNLQWHETFGFLSFSFAEHNNINDVKAFRVKVN